MISKFKKIAAGATMLSVAAFSSNVRAEIPAEGMVGGIFGSYGVATKSNKDTVVNMEAGSVKPGVTTPTAVPAVPVAATGPFTLDAEKDSTWDAGIYLGYLMGNGLEGGLELGYRKFKAKDKTNTKNELEVTDMTALLSGTFYVDMGSSIHPYVNVGVGMARAEAKGVIHVDGAKKDTDMVKFDALKKWIVAYKAGVGVAMTFDNFVVGVGYKLGGFGSMDKGKDYKDATVTYSYMGGGVNPAAVTEAQTALTAAEAAVAAAGATPAANLTAAVTAAQTALTAAQAGGAGAADSKKYSDNKAFDFGKISQMAHSIEVFAKMVF